MTDTEDTVAADADKDDASLDEVLAGSSLLSAGTAPQSGTADSDEDDHEHFEDIAEDHEDVGSPLASKILTGLAVLVAGGVLALWTGPKIAPMLPEGLAPVRAWLMPGAGVSKDDLADLRSTLEAQIAARDEGLTADEVTAMLADIPTQGTDATADIQALRDDLASLGDKVDAMARADLGARLTSVETRLDGIAGQLQSLGTLAESADGLSEDAVAQISKFAAMVEGLRSEIGGLAARDGELATRLDEIAANTERRIADTEDELAQAREKAGEDLKRAAIRNSLTEIENAISSGQPYAEAMARLAEHLKTPVLAQLEPGAQTGVATLAELRDSFGEVARAAIRTDIPAEGEGSALNRLGALVGAQVASRSLTPQEGDSTDAVLSRAEDALRHDDLATSLGELRSLQPAAAAAMAGWAERAQTLLDARQALQALTDMTQAAN